MRTQTNTITEATDVHVEEQLKKINGNGPRYSQTLNKLVTIKNPKTEATCKVKKANLQSYLERGFVEVTTSAPKPVEKKVEPEDNIGTQPSEDEEDDLEVSSEIINGFKSKKELIDYVGELDLENPIELSNSMKLKEMKSLVTIHLGLEE